MINIMLFNFIAIFLSFVAIWIGAIGDNIIKKNSGSLDSLNRSLKYYAYACAVAFMACGFSIASIILCFNL